MFYRTWCGLCYWIKMIGPLYRSSKYLTLHTIINLYRSQIRSKIDYCCHIYAGDAQFSQSLKASQSPCWRRIFFFSHTYRRDVASLSLFYRYFYGKCSDELHSLVQSGLIFTARIYHDTYILRIPSARSKFHSKGFFRWTTALWNKLLRRCFPESLVLTCSSIKLSSSPIHTNYSSTSPSTSSAPGPCTGLKKKRKNEKKRKK